MSRSHSSASDGALRDPVEVRPQRRAGVARRGLRRRAARRAPGLPRASSAVRRAGRSPAAAAPIVRRPLATRGVIEKCLQPGRARSGKDAGVAGRPARPERMRMVSNGAMSVPPGGRHACRRSNRVHRGRCRRRLRGPSSAAEPWSHRYDENRRPAEGGVGSRCRVPCHFRLRTPDGAASTWFVWRPSIKPDHTFRVLACSVPIAASTGQLGGEARSHARSGGGDAPACRVLARRYTPSTIVCAGTMDRAKPSCIATVIRCRAAWSRDVGDGDQQCRRLAVWHATRWRGEQRGPGISRVRGCERPKGVYHRERRNRYLVEAHLCRDEPSRAPAGRTSRRRRSSRRCRRDLAVSSAFSGVAVSMAASPASASGQVGARRRDRRSRGPARSAPARRTSGSHGRARPAANDALGRARGPNALPPVSRMASGAGPCGPGASRSRSRLPGAAPTNIDRRQGGASNRTDAPRATSTGRLVRPVPDRDAGHRAQAARQDVHTHSMPGVARSSVPGSARPGADGAGRRLRAPPRYGSAPASARPASGPARRLPRASGARAVPWHVARALVGRFGVTTAGARPRAAGRPPGRCRRCRRDRPRPSGAHHPDRPAGHEVDRRLERAGEIADLDEALGVVLVQRRRTR